MKEYKIVYCGGEGEIVEKKSRFIATVKPVDSEEEASSVSASACGSEKGTVQSASENGTGAGDAKLSVCT